MRFLHESVKSLHGDVQSILAKIRKVRLNKQKEIKSREKLPVLKIVICVVK